MKKIILIFAVFISTIAVKAQDSNSLGFDNGSKFISGSFKFETQEVGTNRPLNVSVTYNKFIGDDISYGFTLGINSNELIANDYVIGMDVRNYYTPKSQFSVFSKIGFNLTVPAEKGGDNKFDLFVGPGMSYFISKNFIVETSLGLINTRISNDFSQNFSINTDLSGLKLGLAYKF
jgi:hypothetical protein